MRAFSYSTLTLALAGTLLVMAGWRWHSAAVVLPDRILSAGEPSAVLLVQAWDCPDRRAAMSRWLETLRTTAAGEELPVLLAVLDEDAGDLDPLLDALPRLDATGVSKAARAVQRAGIPGTPALLLLDGDGGVLLTDTFATTESAPRLVLAASLLPTILPPSTAGHSHDRDGT